MSTVRDLLRCAEQLPQSSARRDAEILLGHCMGKSRSWLYTWPEATVSDENQACFGQLIQRRAAGEPVAYLTGERDFWSLRLSVGPTTLIPRPETEILVEWALQLPLPADSRVLDLGTGSGAIALAVAAERPRWRVRAVDDSEAALQTARENGEAAGLQRVMFTRSNWYEGLDRQRFDLLLSNPPYIAETDPVLMSGDLAYEPRSALAAGADGLVAIRQVIAGARRHLFPGAWLLVEHGAQQGAAVRALLQQAGLHSVSTRSDLAGRERVSGGARRAR